MTDKKLLKKLLTTASVISVVAGGANAVRATDWMYTTNGGVANWNAAANLQIKGSGASVNAVGAYTPNGGNAGDAIPQTVLADIKSGPNFGSIVDGGGAVNITAADTISLSLGDDFTFDGAAATVKDIDITAAVDAGVDQNVTVTGDVNGGNVATFKFGAAGKTLKFTKNAADLSAVAVDFNNNLSTAQFSGGGKANAHGIVQGTVDNTGGVGGTLQLSGDYLEFQSQIGATNALTAITVDAAKNAFFNGTKILATDITLGAGSNATFNTNGNNVTITADISGAGTVNFTGGDATAGTNGKAVAITTTQGVGTVSGGGITATNIVMRSGAGRDNEAKNGGQAAITLGGGASINTNGVVTMTAGTGGAGGAASIGGNGGATGALGTITAGYLTLTSGAGGAGDANNGGGNGGAVNVAGIVTTTAGANMTTITSGNGGNHAGNAGGNGGQIKFNAAFTVGAGGLTVRSGNGGDGNVGAGVGGKVWFVGPVTVANGGVNITSGAAGNKAAAGGAIQFDDTLTATAGDIAITSGSEALTFTKLITATNGNVTVNNNGAGVMTFTAGVIGTANDKDITINSNNANGVNLTIDGVVTSGRAININASQKAVTITGVATAGNNGDIVVSDATNSVTFAALPVINGTGLLKVGASTANGGVVLNAGLVTGGISFTGDGLVTLVADQDITGNITAVGNPDAALDIEDGNSTITGDIGAAGNALKTLSFHGINKILTINGNIRALTKLDILADGKVSIDHDAHIGTVRFNNAASTLVFAGADNTLTGSVVANANGDGIIDASTKSATVTGNIGANGSNVANIKIGTAGNAQTFTAGGDVFANKITLAHAGSELKVGGGADVTITTAKSIDGAVVNNGVLTIQDKNNVTITGKIGSGQPLHTINLKNTGDFNTVTVVFGDVVKTQNLVLDPTHTAVVQFDGATTITNQIVFTKDDTELQFNGVTTLGNGVDFANHNSTIYIGAADGIQTAGAIISTGGTNGTIIFGNDQTLNADIGAAATVLQAVEIGAHTITLDAHTIFAQDIAGDGAGKGTLHLDNANSRLTAIANGNITSNIKFGNNAAKFTIPDSTVDFTGNVTANADGNGIFEVSGDRAFTKSIGAAGSSIAQLDLQTKNAYTFQHADVYAKAITVADGSELDISRGAGDVNFGQITAKDVTLTLGNKKAVFTNGAVISGNATLNLEVNDVADFGSIEVSGGDLDMGGVNGANALTINITKAVAGVVKGKLFDIITNPGGGNLTESPLVPVINDKMGTVNFTYARGKLMAAADPVGLAVAVAAVKKADPAVDGDAEKIFDVNTTGAAANVAEALAGMPSLEAAKVIADLARDTSQATMSAVSDATQAVTSGIAGRMVSMALPQSFGPSVTVPTSPVQTSSPGVTSTSGTSTPFVTKSGSTGGTSGKVESVTPTKKESTKAGVASGDAFTTTEIGAWLSGFGGVGTQKKLSSTKSGYKSKLAGGSLGLDAKFDEHFIGGLALTYADVTVKHKDTKQGDSTKAPTWIFSAYGIYDFGNNWFTRGIASYVHSKITNKDVRQVGPVGSVVAMAAKGKYTSRSGSLDIGGGYRHFISDYTSLTPSASIQYTCTKDSGYTETGAGNQNLTTKKKNFSTVTANVGASVSSYYDLGQYHMTPEFHGNIHQYLGGKAATVRSAMSGQPDPFVNKPKATKTTYNLGLGLTAKTGSTEFGVGYDAQLAKKYVGHQGSLKVRINF